MILTKLKTKKESSGMENTEEPGRKVLSRKIVVYLGKKYKGNTHLGKGPRKFSKGLNHRAATPWATV